MEKSLKLFDVVDRNGIIVVTSAGNESRTRFDLNEFKSSFPGIIVGGINSRGFRAELSQVGDRVKVYAPAEFLIIVDSENNRLEDIEGTSYSSPIVAGSITNTLMLYPQLNRNLIENLIEKTGIDLPDDSRTKSKIKMINSYKMLRVVKRIKDQMKSLKFVSNAEKERNIYNKISDPAINDFTLEAAELIKSAKMILDTKDCSQLFKAIELYREAFLLSESYESKLALADLYKKVGYDGNSEFYQNLLSVSK